MADRVLVVDDEKLIVKGIRFSLEQDNMQVDCAYDGEEALELARTNTYDIILLDVMLPKLDGFQVCQQIREFSDVPIMMITAKVEEMDRLIGFENGADDYLCKPFSPKEMVARVKALLRRRVGGPTSQSAFVFDAAAQVIRYGEQKLDLTPTELRLFNTLLAQPERVFSRDQLIAQAYHDNLDVFDRAVDSHIKNLRKKIALVLPDVDVVQSVYGMGYRYSPPPE